MWEFILAKIYRGIEHLLQGKHIQVVDWQKRHMKLSQYFALDVFWGVEFKYVVIFDVSPLVEADARILYPLNRVICHLTGKN